MNQVFILFLQEVYEDPEIIGVFSSRENLKEAEDTLRSIYQGRDDLNIYSQEHDLNSCHIFKKAV
jgi:hypothetical protein